MTVKPALHPPLLLRTAPSQEFSVESFLIDRLTTDALSPNVVPPDDVPTLPSVVDDYNVYIFSQYLIYLYLKMFVTESTSRIYRNTLNTVVAEIKTGLVSRQITDSALRDLFRIYVLEGGLAVRADHGLVAHLSLIYNRLRPAETYPGIKEIFRIVYAIYDTLPNAATSVVPYQTKLVVLDGYAAPTLSLESTRHTVSLDTTRFTSFTDLYWKFIYSLNIPESVCETNNLLYYLYLLAQLALPIEPIALTAAMRSNIAANAKTGVPFLNYLAMYLRQRSLGFDYKLSRLADTRRLVMQQIHKFCGVGATFIRDTRYAKPLIVNIEQAIDQLEGEPLSDEEYQILSHLKRAVDGQDQQRVRFLDPPRPQTAIEAAKPKPEVDPTPEPTEPQPTKAKPKTPKKTELDAFADDADPTQPDPAEDDTAPAETGDDTIGQAGDADPLPAPRPPSTLLPLALPTETIDDHLYRLSVLRFVSALCNAPDAKISSEALNLLKVWCGHVLFIAAAQTTKSLLSQLKLTEKMKEFLE